MVTGLVLVALPAPAAARDLDARVVWARGERVYLALQDSASALHDLRLTFVHGRKRLATGEVVDVVESDLVRVRLIAGSLDRVKRLERVRVLAEPVPVVAPSPLRVGLPSSRRRCPIWDCRGDGASRPAGAPLSARAVDAGTLLWIRDPAIASALPWPDTILVRFFDEAIDQEIALERGETDVAVFWPGEVSGRLRADARWLVLRGRRDGGIVAAQWDDATPADSGAAPPDVAPLAALNERMFRGDLEPWPADGSGVPARFVVDASISGRREIERFLDTNPGVRGRDGARAARLVLVDAAGTRAVVTARLAELGAVPAFGIGCPVVCRPALRAFVEALGVDRFANLRTCGEDGAR